MELDDFTKKHLEAWLERTVRRGDKAKVRASIMRLLRSDPDLLNNRSWPELRDLAERESNPRVWKPSRPHRWFLCPKCGLTYFRKTAPICQCGAKTLKDTRKANPMAKFRVWHRPKSSDRRPRQFTDMGIYIAASHTDAIAACARKYGKPQSGYEYAATMVSENPMKKYKSKRRKANKKYSRSRRRRNPSYWTYRGVDVFPADRNSSGIRWYARMSNAPAVLRADTKSSMKALINHYSAKGK